MMLFDGSGDTCSNCGTYYCADATFYDHIDEMTMICVTPWCTGFDYRVNACAVPPPP